MRPNAIKNDVLAGKAVAGAMVFEFFSPGMSAILANAGCRFVLYDMEHTGLGFETLKWLFASCRGLPIEPMVRVPRGEYTWLARALDLGARGVMIPMVESAEQARVHRRGLPLSAGGPARRGVRLRAVRLPRRRRRREDPPLPRAHAGHRADRDRARPRAGRADRRGRRHRRALGRPLRPVQLHGHPRRSSTTRASTPRCARWPRRRAGTARRPASWPPTRAWIARARDMGYTMIAGGTDTGLLELALQGMVGQIEAAGAMSGGDTFRVGLSRDILTAERRAVVRPRAAGAARRRAAHRVGVPAGTGRRDHAGHHGALRRPLRELAARHRRIGGARRPAACRSWRATASATTRSTLRALAARGVIATNTPVAVRRPVAVAALTFIFALAGRLVEKDRLTRSRALARAHRVTWASG